MKRAANRVLRGAWAWLAWVAVAMLAAQPLSAAAMARPQGRTIVVELCSTHTPGKSVAIHLPGAPADKSDCGKCPSCLAAPTLADLAARAEVPSRVVFHEAAVFSADHGALTSLARAPPRPPGQGPPARPNA
jgi:hypothetical protein